MECLKFVGWWRNRERKGVSFFGEPTCCTEDGCGVEWMYEWLNLEQGSCWQYELRSKKVLVSS